MTDLPHNAMLLLTDARGIYIPRDFVTGFDLSKFDGIKLGDAMICQNPDHEWYWEAWEAILENASFVHEGQKFVLHQDGDLWAVPADFEPAD